MIPVSSKLAASLLASASSSTGAKQSSTTTPSPTTYSNDAMNKAASHVAAASPSITSIQTIIKAQQEEDNRIRENEFKQQLRKRIIGF